MLSYFLHNSVIVTWCIQEGVNLVYMIDQTYKNLSNILTTLQYIYFDQQSGKILQGF